MEIQGKYKAFKNISLKKRRWPSNTIKNSPIWCSVDLRDGNQALENPMGIEQKLKFFDLLVKIGFKQIEVGFPASSQTEYDFVRKLITENRIPEDVTIQVLCQAKEHLIKKTIESLRGAKNVIIHLYLATSPSQRKYNFNKSKDELIKLIKKEIGILKSNLDLLKDSYVTLEFSPENFSQTEPDFSVKMCQEIYFVWNKNMTQEQKKYLNSKIIFNLPTTVECSLPNQFADMVEYFTRKLKCIKNTVISIHNHNDRGESIATCELGLLAGAQRVEGCLFGNGERTGNLDIVTVALNMYTQGIDPKLDFSNLEQIANEYASLTNMQIHPRTPYAGQLVFTAFSGSHQDAIRKGMLARKNMNKNALWDVPYLAIDPHDIGREYNDIIRINSQSGKGGAVYILEHDFGIIPPKEMHSIIGKVVKQEADKLQRELQSKEIYELFENKWLLTKEPLNVLEITEKHIEGERGGSGEEHVAATATIEYLGKKMVITASGNGPLDAFVAVLRRTSCPSFNITSFHEHSIGTGSNTHAMGYVQITFEDGKSVWGVGKSSNIGRAGIAAVVSAINFKLEN